MPLSFELKLNEPEIKLLAALVEWQNSEAGSVFLSNAEEHTALRKFLRFIPFVDESAETLRLYNAIFKNDYRVTLKGVFIHLSIQEELRLDEQNQPALQTQN